jgi:hypothetical protein
METIGRQELKAKLDANQDIKLVMTVGGWTFRARHIPGSLNFPSPDRALQTSGHSGRVRRAHRSRVPQRPLLPRRTR